MPPTPLNLSPDRRRPELCRAGAQLRFSFARRPRVGLLGTGVMPAAAPGRGPIGRVRRRLGEWLQLRAVHNGAWRRLVTWRAAAPIARPVGEPRAGRNCLTTAGSMLLN